MSGRLAKAFCSNGYCPRVKEIEIPFNLSRVETVALLAINKSEALQDSSGNYWCKRCKERCDLMNWGKLHNWPALISFPYSVAQGRIFWELAIKMGKDTYVEAIAEMISVAEEV